MYQLKLHLHPSPDYISDCLRHGRFYEQDIFLDLEKYIPNEGTILDIGANIGNHAMMFKQRWPERKIICFEASPINYVLLYHNVTQLSNITPICSGLGEKFEVVDFMHFPQNYGGSGVKSGYKDIVDGLPLDSYPKMSVVINPLDNFDLPDDVSFIKMDVENHELFVIKGGINFIKKYKPVIWIEDFFYDTENEKSPTQYLIDNLGYELIGRNEGNFVLRCIK